jgi:hypothetical protein
MASIALTENRTAEPASTPRPGPLFVVGMWRSGTSLLYALLNQHPQISLMYEGELPVLRPLFLMPGGKSDWAERWNFWNSALDRHQIAADEVSAGVRDLPGAMQAVYQRVAQRKGATIWGCKSPNYYDFLTQLAHDFPGAQFIVIWRGPADICRSVLRAAKKDTWFSKRGIPHRALFGLRRMKQECEDLVRSGIPVHEIAYEDLIHEPRPVMEGICQFLDIPFDVRMTSLVGADRSAIYEGEHHAGVNSEKIVGKELRPEVLSPALKLKIQRYTSLWRKEYGNAWPPAAADIEEAQLATPGLIERAKDQFVFRAMRALDAAVVFVYCFAPISLLRKYRAAKSQEGLAAVPSKNESTHSAAAD